MMAIAELWVFLVALVLSPWQSGFPGFSLNHHLQHCDWKYSLQSPSLSRNSFWNQTTPQIKLTTVGDGLRLTAGLSDPIDSCRSQLGLKPLRRCLYLDWFKFIVLFHIGPLLQQLHQSGVADSVLRVSWIA